MSLTLRIPGRPISSNDRGHWATKARKIKQTRKRAYELALAEWGHPSAVRGTLAYPVTVTVADECRTANLRDTANAHPAVKAAIDGMTDYGLWPDDGPAHVGRIVYLPATKTGVDALVITIEGAN